MARIISTLGSLKIVRAQLSLVNEIVELLRERKDLILRKIKRMFEENAERTEAISRGRLQDLKVNISNLFRTRPSYLETRLFRA